VNKDGGPLPDSDHIARYCRPGCVNQYDNVPLACAFQIRKGEAFLSVNWLEHFDASSEAGAIDEIRAVLRRKLRLRMRGRIAVVNVRDARDATEREFQVTHQPTDNDRLHAGISGYGTEDEWAESFLAGLAAARIAYPAVVGEGLGC